MKPILKNTLVRKEKPTNTDNETCVDKKQEDREQDRQEVPQISTDKGNNPLDKDNVIGEDMQGGKKEKLTEPVKPKEFDAVKGGEESQDYLSTDSK